MEVLLSLPRLNNLSREVIEDEDIGQDRGRRENGRGREEEEEGGGGGGGEAKREVTTASAGGTRD
jgi:hypothetical protein